MAGRKRKAVTYRIDEAIIKAVDKIARENNSSVNRYIESLLYAHCKEKGELTDIYPLGETRGGDRTNKEDKND
ncbi:MAG: hypothetical protein HC862_21875 [Scytonema sp. RU_4_4]|nr:hypothetical protein [Scytonema sp. RU_4_4]